MVATRDTGMGASWTPVKRFAGTQNLRFASFASPEHRRISAACGRASSHAPIQLINLSRPPHNLRNLAVVRTLTVQWWLSVAMRLPAVAGQKFQQSLMTSLLFNFFNYKLSGCPDNAYDLALWLLVANAGVSPLRTLPVERPLRYSTGGLRLPGCKVCCEVPPCGERARRLGNLWPRPARAAVRRGHGKMLVARCC